MRISSALASLLLVAACADEPDSLTFAEKDSVACALSGANGFDSRCGIERVAGEGGPELILRHPDGGFRRFAVDRDAGAIVAADGAQVAQAQLDAETLELSVGDDRYRLPTDLDIAPPE